MSIILAIFMAVAAITPVNNACIQDENGLDSWGYWVTGNPTFGPDVDYVYMFVYDLSHAEHESAEVLWSGGSYGMEVTHLIQNGTPFYVVAKGYDINNNLIGTTNSGLLIESMFSFIPKIMNYTYSPYVVRTIQGLGL